MHAFNDLKGHPTPYNCCHLHPLLSTHVRNYGDVFRLSCWGQSLGGDLGQKGVKIATSEGPFKG